MGCGGAGVAITWFLLLGDHRLGRPKRVIVSDVSAERLAHLEKLVDTTALEVELVRDSKDNDRILEALRERSLVINADVPRISPELPSSSLHLPRIS